MASDIVIFDNLIEFKRMLNSEEFAHLEKRFNEVIQSKTNLLLSYKVDGEEAEGLRREIIALKSCTPATLGEEILTRAAKKSKARHPEVFR